MDNFGNNLNGEQNATPGATPGMTSDITSGKPAEIHTGTPAGTPAGMPAGNAAGAGNIVTENAAERLNGELFAARSNVFDGNAQNSGSGNGFVNDTQGNGFGNFGNGTQGGGGNFVNGSVFGGNVPGGNKSDYSGDTSRIKSLMKTIGILALVLVFAFSGAFYGMYAICRTALFGNSDILSALILENSGIVVHKTEVDLISGEYADDGIALAEKVLQTTVEIRVLEYKEDEYTEIGAGSGVIVSEDGYILTNYHVVYGVTHFNVVLHGGKTYKGEIVALDRITDIAIVKIEPDAPLAKTAFGDSTKIKYGQNIVVAGNPLGGGLAVSFGNIANPDKNIGDESGNFIQVDASVNPGNSGGGLYDCTGALVGIVTAKASGNNVDGIGYAIPSDRAISVMSDLMNFGYVKGRPALGISVVDVTSSTWAYFSENDLKGYLYDKEKTGVYIVSSNHFEELRAGDRIISVAGLKIDVKEEVSGRLRRFKVGDKIKISVERIANIVGDKVYYEVVDVEVELYERDWSD